MAESPILFIHLVMSSWESEANTTERSEGRGKAELAQDGKLKWYKEGTILDNNKFWDVAKNEKCVLKLVINHYESISVNFSLRSALRPPEVIKGQI